jgi:hypothetical protein
VSPETATDADYARVEGVVAHEVSRPSALVSARGAFTAMSLLFELPELPSPISPQYFHNWTGNRVTCRDWFQLTLKEGLTVFRDQVCIPWLGELALGSRLSFSSATAAQLIAFKWGPGLWGGGGGWGLHHWPRFLAKLSPSIRRRRSSRPT